MPNRCPGYGPRECSRHARVAYSGNLCSHCRLKQSGRRWGGHRQCFVKECLGVSVKGRSRENTSFRSLRDAVATVPFCRDCLRKVTDDLNLSPARTTARKMNAFMSRNLGHFLIVIRRFGRSQIVHTRAAALLKRAKCPFLNTLCLADRPKHREEYLKHYCRDPDSWLLVPKGASTCTDFLSHAAAKVLCGSQLLHVVDDNLQDVVLTALCGDNGKDLPVGKEHLFALLKAGEQAVRTEGASAWGLSCFQPRSYMAERPRASMSEHRNRWYKNKAKCLEYTTFPRLLYGGFFAMKPTVDPRYCVPASYGVQDDVVRTMLATIYTGKIVLFPRFLALKAHNESGGCVQSAGGKASRERRNDWIRRRLMTFVSSRARSRLERDRIELIKTWWRRSRFLRKYVTN